MDRIVTHSTVGGDGTLVVPLGFMMAGRDVQVTVEPASSSDKPPEMTRDEWQAFILSTAGSIADPTFCRHEQGEDQERDSLE